MNISSFDIFDTCLVRKCGSPEIFFDVLSLKVFTSNAEEWARQEFVAARRIAEQHVAGVNPHYTLHDIWAAFSWTHPLLKSTDKLCQLEQDLEREMLLPVLRMREKVNACRVKGDKIVFISDMYLSVDFLTDVMREHGFYQDGDSLYVSCECMAAKWDGELFRYVKQKEDCKSWRNWTHYGDNHFSDYEVPKKLGITCELISHPYSPYQQQWISNDYSLGYKYPSILAGIGRALRYNTEWTTHTDFVLDIVAPFYCSWIYQVMEDAQKKGIKRLYFCARDAHQIHKIAQIMQPYFPQVGIEYVYMSRVALYKNDNSEAKLAYYKRIGLATDKENVAIVDITTSGKSLIVLNEFLKKNGCNEVYAYYFLLWNKVAEVDRTKYNVQVYDEYDYYRNAYLHLYLIFEIFFSLNSERKTIDYTFVNGIAEPVFCPELEEGDVEIRDNVDWVSIHTHLLSSYVRLFMQFQLGKYAKLIFENIGLRALRQFYGKPIRPYIMALKNVYYKNWECRGDLACIKKFNWFGLLKKSSNDYIWWEGSLYYSFSQKVINRIYFHFPWLYKLMNERMLK